MSDILPGDGYSRSLVTKKDLLRNPNASTVSPNKGLGVWFPGAIRAPRQFGQLPSASARMKTHHPEGSSCSACSQVRGGKYCILGVRKT